MEQTRLATLWCSKCDKMTPHRVNPAQQPRCLTCEDEPGVIDIPPPPKEEMRIQYPGR